MDAAELVQRLREQRLTTLALADQIKEDRWCEPALPGGRTIHDALAHILAWDEWAFAVFDISRSRDLPPVLVNALRDVDAYNARHVHRMRNLTRDDILSALQDANPRLLKAAMSAGGAEWNRRRIPDLAEVMPGRASAATPQPPDAAPLGPSVGGILRTLIEHEAAHDREIMETFGIEPHLEQFTSTDEQPS